MLPRILVSARVLSVALGLGLTAVACLADEPAKPRCSSKTQGSLWPEEANNDPRALQQAARSGKLEVCAATTWRYRWQPMTVTVSQLAESHGRRGKSSEDVSRITLVMSRE